MKNTTNTNTIKTTTLCKQLLNNALYTTKEHYIGKSIGENIYKEWQKALADLKTNSFQYYEALANERENLEVFEKSVYTSIKNLLTLVGTVPCKEDKTVSSKINSAILFQDAINLSVKLDSKVEISKLVSARENLRLAKKEYRDNCLTDNGFVKQGLNQNYIDSFTSTIEKCQAEINKLLQVKGNSVFGTSEVKLSTFAKKFEIQLRKAMLKQYNFTVAEVKAKKQAQKQERKANRSKTTTTK